LMMSRKTLFLSIYLVLGSALCGLVVYAHPPSETRGTGKNQVKEALGISQNVHSQADLHAKHPEIANQVMELLRSSKEGLDSVIESAQTDKWAFLGRLLAELNAKQEPRRQVWLKEIHEIRCECQKNAPYSAFRETVDCDAENVARARESTLLDFFSTLETMNDVLCESSNNSHGNHLLDKVRGLKTDAKCSVDIAVESLWQGTSRMKLSVRTSAQLLSIPLGKLSASGHSALNVVPLKIVAQRQDTKLGNMRSLRHSSSYQTPSDSLNNGSDSLSELFRLGKQTLCSRDEFDLCKPGTVDLTGEAPFQSSLRLQRALESHLPLNYAHFFHTHNS
jgi:hypothetical protein